MQVTNATETTARLDVFLHENVPALSRRESQRVIADGHVRVNGRRARKSQSVLPGDVVSIDDDALTPAVPEPAGGLAIEVIYEDAAMVVVDKPAGVPTVALRGASAPTVAGFLVARYPGIEAAGDQPLEAGIVHRLDNDTSGLLIAARTPQAYAALREQFRARHVTKEYTALVHGAVREEGEIEAPIAPERGRRDRMRVTDRTARGARNAETTFRPLRQVGDATLLAVRIRTGVRHQIRVHLAGLGYPLVGDTHYGAPRTEGVRRHMLHACFLEVDHPLRPERHDFRSALPADFLEAIRRFEFRRGRRR